MSHAHPSWLLSRSNGAVAPRPPAAREAATAQGRTIAQRVAGGAPSRSGLASLTVTVDETDALRVRRALNYCGARSVHVVKLIRVPGSTRVRLCIGLDADAVPEAMNSIMGSVSAAEFGPVALN